jgi:formylglycine-generating enzyme required for sulfatase activity
MKGGLAHWVVDTYGAALSMTVDWPELGEPAPSPAPMDPRGAQSALDQPLLEDPVAAMIDVGPAEGWLGEADTPLESGHALGRVMQVTHTPLRQVRLDRAYAIGRVAVTQAQWRGVMGEDPPGLTFPGDQRPVHGVSWTEAAGFCNALSDREGLSRAYEIAGDRVQWADPDGPGYRLPTDAEWEVACRGGTETPFWTGEELTAAQANFDTQYEGAESSGGFHGGPMPVGCFPANPFGLFDTHGNVCEWTWGDATPSTDEIDPTPRGSGQWRPVRGGSWALWRSRWCASGYRLLLPPAMRGFDIGFRLARTLGG